MDQPNELPKNVDQANQTLGGQSAVSVAETDQSDSIFSLYVGRADEYDKSLVEGWKDDMDSLLIFAGLFSAIVTAFIVESYKGLKPDLEDQILSTLLAMSRQMGAIPNDSLSGIASASPSNLHFTVTTSTLAVNGCWFLSLALSLVCALTATLVKQWGRNYLREVNRQPAAYKRAQFRTFLFQGTQKFGMVAIIEAVPTLLHLSLFLFFIGLVEFLHPINHIICFILLSFFVGCATLYAITVIIPSFYLNCPYQTPLSHVWWRLMCASRQLIARGSRIRISKEGGLQGGLTKAREIQGLNDHREGFQRDLWALKWTVTQLNEDNELEPFIQGIPSFVELPSSEGRSNRQRMLRCLMDNGLGHRIAGLLLSCNHSGILDASRMHRALVCLDAIWSIADSDKAGPSWQMWFPSDLLLTLRNFATSRSPIAAPASCTMAVVANMLLNHFTAASGLHALAHSSDMSMLMGLPILQPMQSILSQWFNADLAEKQHIMHFILPHLREARFVLLVEAASAYVRDSSPLRRRAALSMMAFWANDPPRLSQSSSPSLILSPSPPPLRPSPPPLRPSPACGLAHADAPIQVPLLSHLGRVLSDNGDSRRQPLLADLGTALGGDPRLAWSLSEDTVRILRTIAGTLRTPPWSEMAKNILNGRIFSDGVDMKQLSPPPPEYD